ncbi:zinc finger protein 7-like [Mytilus californianus]|uniref:zinc finger protein 7-like n=1 Tax=Mytilus californianus TaxID=6549 RepID=UPI0022485C55|nr:zinc finger protein 7-like [Mytilus californianus]
MELSLQEDIVENNDEIKVEGEILTWDTLWFEVCSSGEHIEDNKETVNTFSETAGCDQVICCTEINNDDASGSILNIQNIESKGNDVSAVTTKRESSQKPEHANDYAVAEVKRKNSSVMDEATGSPRMKKACATNQDTLSRTSKENNNSENETSSSKKKNEDTSASVLNKNDNQNIGSKDNVVGAVIPKSASSKKPEHANDETTAEVKRRTSSVRDEANKDCATHQDTLGRTSKENDYAENQIISSKKSNGNKEVTISDKKAQFKTSGVSIKYKQNVNKHDIKSTCKSERGNVEKMFDSTEWDTSTSLVKKKTQIIEKLKMTIESEHLEKRNKENQKDTTQNWPCNELPDSQTGITNNTVNDLLGEIEIYIPSQLNEEQFNKMQSTTNNSEHLEDAQIQETVRLIEDQFNNLNSVTMNNNESGQSHDHDDSENFTSSVLNSGSNSQQDETSYDHNDRSCQSARSQYGWKDCAKIINVTPQIKECDVIQNGQSVDHDDSENFTSSVLNSGSNSQQVETSYDHNDQSWQSARSQYGRKDSAKIINVTPQIKECYVVLKDTQYGRKDSAKIININPQIKECNVVLKDTKYGRTDSAKTINVNVNPHIKECYVVLKDFRKGNELTENTANNQSTALTNRRVVNACNDLNGDEENLNSLRANDKETKEDKSFGSRLEVNNQKQKGNICKGQKLNKLGNQKFRFPCGKEFKYTCNVCYKKFNKSRHLIKHSRIHTRVITKTQKPKTTHWCFPCGKEFERISWLKVHQRIHTDERPYSCNVCNKKFKNSSHLKKHTLIHTRIRTKIQKQKTTHWCFPCGKEFNCMSRLKEHQKIHTDEMPYSCNVCCKTFKKLGYLKQHTRIHTSVISNLQMQKTTHWCFPCGKEFKRVCRLREHQKSHSDERPYSCCLCSRKFKKIYNLKLHRRIHTGETPYKCEFCDKKFRYGSSLWRMSKLKIHESSHAGVKIQHCDLCGQDFRNKSSLKLHNQIHTGENYFNCDQCDRSFKEASKLQNTGTPSMMDGRKMSTEKDVTEEEAAPKASNFKTAEKQITKTKGPNYPCSKCGKVFNQKKFTQPATTKMYLNVS